LQFATVDGKGAPNFMSVTANPVDSGAIVGSVCVTDPVTGVKQQVGTIHTQNQLSLATFNSSLGADVGQVWDNVANVFNNEVEASHSNQSPLGMPVHVPYVATPFKTTVGTSTGSGATTFTVANSTGTTGGVSWSIKIGSKLVIDTVGSGVQELVTVANVNYGTNVVTLVAATVNAHTGPFQVSGFTYNPLKDGGAIDGSGGGLGSAAQYLWNGGDTSVGQYDRARSVTAKGGYNSVSVSGGSAGATTITAGGTPTGLQPGQKVLLYKASAFAVTPTAPGPPASSNFESANVSMAYIPGSTTIPLEVAIVGSVGYTQIAWDSFSALGIAGGIGSNSGQILPFGVGTQTLFLTDPMSGFGYGVRNAPGHLGTVQVSSDHAKATFRYAGFWNPAATPTDAIIIQGSSSKTIRIKYIMLGGVATTAGNLATIIIRRSSAPTGGTLVGITPAKLDINDPTPTAVLSVVTANITTLGTTVANIGQRRLVLPLAGAVQQPIIWNFCANQDKSLILRGTTDYVCVNFSGGALPAGAAVDFEVETEEDLS
jgi:hypothetical protein